MNTTPHPCAEQVRHRSFVVWMRTKITVMKLCVELECSPRCLDNCTALDTFSHTKIWNHIRLTCLQVSMWAESVAPRGVSEQVIWHRVIVRRIQSFIQWPHILRVSYENGSHFHVWKSSSNPVLPRTTRWKKVAQTTLSMKPGVAQMMKVILQIRLAS